MFINSWSPSFLYTKTRTQHRKFHKLKFIIKTRRPVLISPTSYLNACPMCTLHPMWCFVRQHCFVYVLHHAQRLSKMPYFWGLCTQARAITLKFKLGRDFCMMYLPPSFIILCLLVRKLSSWQAHKHTQIHRQTNRFHWKHATFFAMLRRWVNTSQFSTEARTDATVCLCTRTLDRHYQHHHCRWLPNTK